jgi:mannose-6-phosphate isomerase-like protein (cupin superfamily)
MQKRIIGVCSLLVAGAVGYAVAGQVMEMSKPGADFHTVKSLEDQGKALLIEAGKTPGGSATGQLEKYPGHFTSLTARTKSGGAELHRRWNDIFVAVDGEAVVITGGKMVNPKDSAVDEQRGTSVEGGESHTMHKGDVLHISTNTPHQTTVPAGKTFTYYVVKVEDPTWKAPAAK